MTERYSLVGRRIIITGADSGIGRQCLDDALASGAECAALVRDSDAAASLRGTLADDRIHKADFAQPATAAPAVNSAIEALGGVDGVVCSAGIFDERGALDTELADVERVLAINLTAHFEVARECGRVMARAGRGAMVLLSSQIGVVGYPKAAAYAASKGGINAFAKTLAIELAGSGVRVNAVAPGPVVTPMTADARADSDRADAMLAAIPLGRLGETADISAAVQYLLSDAASFVTGQVLCVDGGFTAA